MEELGCAGNSEGLSLNPLASKAWKKILSLSASNSERGGVGGLRGSGGGGGGAPIVVSRSNKSLPMGVPNAPKASRTEFRTLQMGASPQPAPPPPPGSTKQRPASTCDVASVPPDRARKYDLLPLRSVTPVQLSPNASQVAAASCSVWCLRQFPRHPGKYLGIQHVQRAHCIPEPHRDHTGARNTRTGAQEAAGAHRRCCTQGKPSKAHRDHPAGQPGIRTVLNKKKSREKN